MEQNFKIAVPDGCTASIKQEEGFVIVSFYLKKWEPKDGDIVAFGVNGIGIFKEFLSIGIGMNNYITLSGDSISNDGGWTTSNLRPATEEEKRRLFDALAKEGKRWNPETKRIEDLPRWRAEKGERYYCICADSTIYDLIEEGDQTDNTNYEYGNYFRTREAAGKVAEQVSRIFKESKAE